MGQRPGSRRSGGKSYNGIGHARTGTVGTSTSNRQNGMIHRVSKFRLLVLALIALLPSFLMRPCYRLFFSYRMGKRVRIGFSIIDVQECQIEDDVKIGHLNVIIGVRKLV